MLMLGSTCVAGESAADLTVHEWGTFTSVQGSDGNLLDWQGAEIGELPNFVHDWSNPGLQRHTNAMMAALLTKERLPSLQRMETPVIYFYSDVNRLVDVVVDFPQGTITEWYPQATEIGSSHQAISKDPSGGPRRSPGVGSLIRWSRVEVQPKHTETTGAPTLPGGMSGNHYFAARATDSATLRVSVDRDADGIGEREKFLFYRGVGRFGTPLTVTVTNGLIQLSNTGTIPLRNLFILQIRDGLDSSAVIAELNPDNTRAVRLIPAVEPRAQPPSLEQLSHELQEALVSEGLFRREAEAMVNTWRDTWFQDPGVRVLYILPREWTDRTLPISVNPQPTELARVMVGRAEVIAPELQEKLSRCVRSFVDSDPADLSQALQQIKTLNLGQFTVPALNLVIRLEGSQDAEFTAAATLLREAFRAAGDNMIPPPRAQTSSGRWLQNGG